MPFNYIVGLLYFYKANSRHFLISQLLKVQFHPAFRMVIYLLVSHSSLFGMKKTLKPKLGIFLSYNLTI